MQCSRCSYIQFKISSKCANCGYDFKKLKSDALREAENTFTIFATVGAEAGYGNTSREIEADLPEGPLETDMDGTELYDSDHEELTDQNESHVDNFGDFALDLTEVDGPDSESWDIGATLAEDLSETTGTDTEGFMKDADLENGDFEVQGLGFDVNTGLDQSDTKGSTDLAIDEEESPELEDFFLPDSDKDSSAESDEITLETELTIEDNEAQTTSEMPVDPKDSEIELSPTLELEELSLDLETDSVEIKPMENDLPTNPEAPTEEIELKMEPSEEDTDPSSSDEEPTPDR